MRLQLAAQRLGEFLVGTDRIGEQESTAAQVFLQGLALGGGKLKRSPAMHEDERIVEQLGVVRGEQPLVVIDPHLQLPVHDGEQVVERGWRVVGPARVAELGHDECAARRLAARIADRELRAVELFFQLAAGGVGQHVAADARHGLDLGFDRRGIVALAIRMRQLPVARQAPRAIDDAGAAAGIEPPQPELGVFGQMLGIDLFLGEPDRMIGRQLAQLAVRETALRSSPRKLRSKAVPSQPWPSHASANRKPPFSIYCLSTRFCSALKSRAWEPLRKRTGASIRSAVVTESRSPCTPPSRARRRREVDRLPRKIALPLLLDAHRQVLHGPAMMVPIAAAAGHLRLMLELGDHDGPAALREEQQGQRRADDAGRFRPGPGRSRRCVNLSWLFEQHFAAFAIPVVRLGHGVCHRAAPRADEKPLPRHAPDALQGIQVVEPPVVVRAAQMPPSSGLRSTEKCWPIQTRARSTSSFSGWAPQHCTWPSTTLASLAARRSRAMISEAIPAQVMLPVGRSPAR